MKLQLFVISLIMALSAYALNVLTDKRGYITIKLRQLLGIRSISEFLVDFEISREKDLPMNIDERDINNMTNRDFYFEYIGGYYPVVFRGYYANLTFPDLHKDDDLLREQLKANLPQIMEKNLKFEGEVEIIR